MGTGAGDIAEIVSEIHVKLPDLEPPPTLESEEARFRLFDSITTFLKSASSASGGLLFVLDDLHWADPSSLRLLEFLTPELAGCSLLLIGTYRDVDVSRGHALYRALGELTRERNFQRLLVRGLTQEEVGTYIQIISGTTPEDAVAEAIHTRTEGNPLFVTELTRLLAQEDALSADRVVMGRIPEGIREVIGRRLDGVSDDCNRVLSVASVIGGEFTGALLGRLLDDLAGDRLLEVLEEAVAAGLVEELEDSVGGYRFAHTLIQQALSADLSTARRVRLHARVAEALEESYGERAEDRAAELAHHFGEAEIALGTEKLVRYSILAGDQALARYAWEDAAAHFQRALEANEGHPMDAKTAAALSGLGLAQAALFRHAEAQDSLTAAFNYYVGVGDKAEVLEIVESLPPGSVLLGLTDLTARALELVPSDSLQEGRVLCRHRILTRAPHT